LDKIVKIEAKAVQYPKNDIFVCPNCATQTNLTPMRMQVEAQTGQKVIF
jgi:hypothetical protein